MHKFVPISLFALSLFLFAPNAYSAPPTQPPSLEAMIGQMIMVGFRGDGAHPLSQELRGLLEDIEKGRIGGVILFERDWQTKQRGRNIVSLPQVAALATLLQKNAAVPLFIAVDQEGGRVQRLRSEHGFPNVPSAAELGKNRPEKTRDAALRMGEALRKVGVNVNFAPVADVAVNPKSPAIGGIGRAFSQYPEIVARHAAAFAEGLAAAKIISCYKHFPGHGSAIVDPHHKLTDVTAVWNEKELLPYKSENLPPNIPMMIMTGHLLHKNFDPLHPASLSRAITTELLRDKLGWNGVVVTDDLEMNAVNLFYSLEDRIRLAINAGADIVLFGNNIHHHPQQGRRIHAVIRKLAAEGTVSAERIEESWRRIQALKKRLQ